MLHESILHHGQEVNSLSPCVDLMQMMESCDRKDWLAGISADQIFTTSVHRPDNPHMGRHELHLNALRTSKPRKVKKDTDSERSEVCVAQRYQHGNVCLLMSRLCGQSHHVAEFLKCKGDYLFPGEVTTRPISS